MTCSDGDDEAQVVRVVVANRVDHFRPEIARISVDRGRVAKERVQILHARQRVAARIPYPENAVDRLDDIAVPDAERLVRRLSRKLVAAIGETLVAMIQPIKTEDEP